MRYHLFLTKSIKREKININGHTIKINTKHDFEKENIRLSNEIKLLKIKYKNWGRIEINEFYADK